MPSFESVFHQIAAVLFLAAAVGVAARRLRQPLIVAFILTGLLVGPSGLGIVRGQEEITVLADIGIALLLFVVGLKLDLHLIRSVGPVALAAGLGQVAFTSVIGFGIALVLGQSSTARGARPPPVRLRRGRARAPAPPGWRRRARGRAPRADRGSPVSPTGRPGAR